MAEIHEKEKTLIPKSLISDVTTKKKPNEEIYNMVKNN
jgi:hypothetical protein